jgi:SAM-dependent methyltransferase
MTVKPIVNTGGLWLSPNPSKNYLFHLLLQDIRSLNPQRSLDAGTGELRNYWMFPGAYVGISHNRPAYFRGLVRGFNKALIAEKGAPEVYLMRLEREFSFLGLFDLCVCTQTIDYAENPIDVGLRLAARVKPGGSFLLDDVVERAPAYIAALSDAFERLEIVYWGHAAANINFKNMPALANQPPPPDFTALFEREMTAANEPEGHNHFYLRASGKKATAQSEGEVPEMIVEGGLRIVKADMPHLKMTD